MATVTPNFNWPVPTSTDLVKDGATAIEALGDSIDASLVDLKGGTTGQVLSKTSNTDMDFTWVAADDTNAIQNTIVDAKGDLIAASAADTPARLAVGNNGETLVADSSTSTGLRWQGSMAGGKNAVINGGFDIWQRGTSFSNPNVVYTADRWQAGTHAAATFSRQASDLTGFQYFARYQRNSGSSVTTAMTIANSLETSTSLPFAGKTITFSFYARAGANYSATGNNLNFTIASGTGTDQNVFGTYTGFSALIGTSAVLTTSWQRFSATVNVGSTATELAFYLTETPTGTAGAADYFDITGVQLELGSVATNFSRAGGTIQGELAACQRYYFRQGGNTIYQNYGTGYAKTSTQAWGFIDFPVAMRVPPTSFEFSNLAFLNFAQSLFAMTSVAIDANINSPYSAGISGTIVGGTAGHTGQVMANATTGSFVGFSAEL
jgi:hypothetical protein